MIDKNDDFDQKIDRIFYRKCLWDKYSTWMMWQHLESRLTAEQRRKLNIFMLVVVVPLALFIGFKFAESTYEMGLVDDGSYVEEMKYNLNDPAYSRDWNTYVPGEFR